MVYIKSDRGGFGTGFIIGIRMGTNASGLGLYSPFLVTNRHVIKDTEILDLTLNTQSGCHTAKANTADWEVSTDGCDVAVLSLNGQYLNDIQSAENLIPEDQIIVSQENFLSDVKTGQEVFLLGFPLGITGIEKTYAIARMGIVARNDKELIKEGIFYLDIENFPGNSGGPVFVKPSVFHFEGEDPLNHSKLIGFVSAYKPSQTQLYDIRTNPPTPKMVIEENSGIALAIPAYKAVELAKKKIERDAMRHRSVSTPQQKAVSPKKVIK